MSDGAVTGLELAGRFWLLAAALSGSAAAALRRAVSTTARLQGWEAGVLRWRDGSVMLQLNFKGLAKE